MNYCSNHKVEPTCGCGKNTFCRNCGNGTGTYPCDCTPKIFTHNRPPNASAGAFKIADDFNDPAEIWRMLADL